MDYLEILRNSHVISDSLNESQPRSRLDYIGSEIFDFTTYDSEMSELFAAKALEVCAAVSAKATFKYIEDPDNYRWYLLMCNMPFFANRLEWGGSIRGAWWYSRKYELPSCGIFIGDEQETDLEFADCAEWELFVAALIAFATEETKDTEC